MCMSRDSDRYGENDNRARGNHKFVSKAGSTREECMISSLQRLSNSQALKHYALGIGDDAAVRPGNSDEQLIVTADASVEDVHFSLSYMTLEEAGFKAMAGNVSDCAAMGARVDSAIVQLGYPCGIDHTEKKITQLYQGFHQACTRWEFGIAGGDLTSSPCWWIGITLIASLPAEARVLQRSGVRHDDVLWLHGLPGRSAAGMAALRAFGRENALQEYPALVQAHIRPLPDIDTGIRCGADPRVHAVMDCSDGISKDGASLAAINDCGLLIDEEALVERCSGVLGPCARRLGVSVVEWALNGGEEYALLMATSPEFTPYDDSFVSLGRFESGMRGVWTVDAQGRRTPRECGGWDSVR